jgi:hypothetical protein
MSDLEEQRPGISRRTVAKAAAWSVPVVALAVSTPAYAASPGIITLTGGGCKLPGNSNDAYKGNAFGASIENSFNVPITITITGATLNGQDLGTVTVIELVGCTVLGASFVIPANTTFSNVAILTQNAANSSNGTLVISYTITGGPGGAEQATGSVSAVPPIQGASCKEFTSTERACINSAAD